MAWSRSAVLPSMPFVATLALATLCLARPVRAAAPLLDGEIPALAQAGDLVAALRAGEVWLLSADGRLIGKAIEKEKEKIEKIDRRHGGAARRRRPRAEDVIDLLGLPDDDLESDLVRDALDDEGASPARRRRNRAGPYLDDPSGDPPGDPSGTLASIPVALVSSRDAIWIAGDNGLQRLDARAARELAVLDGAPLAPRPRALAALAVAHDGRRLAAIAGHEVWRSTDGAGSWSLLAVTPTRPRALALPLEGDEVYVLDEEGVALLAHRQRFPIFTGHASDLTWCGDELLIAGADGLFAWRWNKGLDRRGDRLPARRLTCAPAQPPITIAFGPDLALSRDGGRTWLARPDLAAGEIEAVAATATALWLGTSSGLYLAPLTARAPAADPAPAPVPAPTAAGIAAASATPDRRAPTGATGAPLPAILRWRASWWRDLLPAVSLLATRSRTRPGADRGAIWLLVTIPLGDSHPHAARAVRLAEELLRRRAQAAAALARTSLLAPGDDEAAALMRLARDNLHEAVR